MTSVSRPRTAAGEALNAHLLSRGRTQASLASDIRATQPYVSQLVNGARQVTPEWLGIIASALELSDEERKHLNALAALDAGFEIDLT